MTYQTAFANTRARILADLSAVPGITGGAAKVYDYFRYETSEDVRDLFFVAAGKLHTWMITLAPDNPAAENTRFPATQGQATLHYEIHGYYALDDANASEKTFHSLVLAVIDAFEADKKLAGTGSIEAGPIQWPQAGHVAFPPGEGGVLCHYARLSLGVLVQTEP